MSITSDEVNYLVYRYLQESGFVHASYAFQSEAHIAKNEYRDLRPTPGALIKYLQKGLLYHEAEVHLLDDGTERGCTKPFSLLRPHECDKSVNRPKVKKEEKKRPKKQREKDPSSPAVDAMDVESGFAAAHTPAPIIAPASLAASPLASAAGAVSPASALPAPVSAKNFLWLKGHTADVFQCVWNPRYNALATGSADSTARIWRLALRTTAGGGLVQTVDEQIILNHADGEKLTRLSCLDWRYDGEYLATGALDNLARLWALDGTLKVVFRGHTAPVFGVRFSPSGKLVVTAGVDSLCIVWDAATGSKLRAFAGHSQAAMDVDWMSDTIYASVSCDKFCFVQDIDREEPLRQFSGHKRDINNVRWSPNKKYLATCADDFTCLIYDMEHRAAIHVLADHTKEVYAVRWSPNGSLLATSALDHTVKVYQMPGAKLLYDLTLHTNPVYSIAFSPNGRYLASGSMDKLVFVYDLATGAVIKSYNCEGRVYDVKWDHKSERIAVSKSPCEALVIDFQLS